MMKEKSLAPAGGRAEKRPRLTSATAHTLNTRLVTADDDFDRVSSDRSVALHDSELAGADSVKHDI